MSRFKQSLVMLVCVCLGFTLSHLGIHNSLKYRPNAVNSIMDQPLHGLQTITIANTSASNSECNCSVQYNIQDNGALHISLGGEPPLQCSCHCLSNYTTPSPPEDCSEKPNPQPWYASHRVWHYPIKFPRCSMDACFNFSKCHHRDGKFLVYSYNSPSPPVRFFSHINSTSWHTDDPSQACLFFVFLDLDTPHRPNAYDLPYWNGGLNHVLITFADKWSQRGLQEDRIGMASLMVSEMHETTYRPGFDISIPLPANIHLHQLQSLKPFERKYLLTFRGMRYLGLLGEGTLRSDSSFRGMHNGVDIIVATTCKHFINDMKRAKDPSVGIYCDEDDAMYSNFSYHDLMNTTFGLVPAGIQPNSYRFIEVLSTGAIPILIVDNYVKPFDTLIQWHHCLLQFPSTEMHRIVPRIRVMEKKEVEQRQKHCLKYYDEFLKDDETLLRSTISSLKSRFFGMIPFYE